jgi:hypothetical protein
MKIYSNSLLIVSYIYNIKAIIMINNVTVLDSCDFIITVLLFYKGDIALSLYISFLIILAFYIIDPDPDSDPKDDKKNNSDSNKEIDSNSNSNDSKNDK